MNEEAAPERIAVIWSPEARVDVRAIERATAMQILNCIDRYLANRAGDVKKLKPPRTGFRLRCGEYRVFFDLKGDNGIEITGVRNRREAYRQSRKGRCVTAQPMPKNCGSLGFWLPGVRSAMKSAQRSACRGCGRLLSRRLLLRSLLETSDQFTEPPSC